MVLEDERDAERARAAEAASAQRSRLAISPRGLDAPRLFADGTGADRRVVVLSVQPGSQAEEHPEVVPGLPLERVASVSVDGLSYTEVPKIIGEHPDRPLPGTFGALEPPGGARRAPRGPPTGGLSSCGARIFLYKKGSRKKVKLPPISTLAFSPPSK